MATEMSSISADEIALYDRQIRLWGVKAQEAIRSANILLINLKALGNEIAKNLVLAGIGSLTIIDNEPISDDDLGSQFFINEDDVGNSRAQAALPRIQELNPRVNVFVEPEDALMKDPTFFSAYDIIIATDLPVTTLLTLDAAVRFSQRAFYAAGSHGLYGFVFADLTEHTFVIERAKSNVKTVIGPETATRRVVSVSEKQSSDGKGTMELVTKHEIYQPMILANTSPLPPEYLNSRRRMKQVTPLLACLRALWDFEKNFGRPPSHSRDDLANFTRLATENSRELQLPMDHLKSEFLRSFLQNLGSELAPVCAVLGGKVAEDVINVLGKREQPIQNMLLFDGEASVAPVYALYPLLPETMDGLGDGLLGDGMTQPVL